jgi:hypothetical protein
MESLFERIPEKTRDQALRLAEDGDRSFVNLLIPHLELSDRLDAEADYSDRVHSRNVLVGLIDLVVDRAMMARRLSNPVLIELGTIDYRVTRTW